MHKHLNSFQTTHILRTFHSENLVNVVQSLNMIAVTHAVWNRTQRSFTPTENRTHRALPRSGQEPARSRWPRRSHISVRLATINQTTGSWNRLTSVIHPEHLLLLHQKSQWTYLQSTLLRSDGLYKYQVRITRCNIHDAYEIDIS